MAGAAPFRNLPFAPNCDLEAEAERTGRAWYSTQLLVRLTDWTSGTFDYRRSHTAIPLAGRQLIFLVAATPRGQQNNKHTDRLEGIDRPDEQRVYHLNSLSL